MQSIPLWPVKMYDFQWPEHNIYKQELIRVCDDLEASKKASGVAPGAKSNLYESGFDFCKIDNPAVLAMSHFMKNSLFQAASDANKGLWQAGMNIQVEIHESWCHITQDGGYHDMHVHPNSSWSAIYYLELADTDVKTKNGLNRFYRPYDVMWTDAANAYLSRDNSIDINAEEGQLIVFPSFVQHAALTYRGKRPRYVIAINSQFTVARLDQVAISI